jgi:hypothetical protein
MGQHGPALSAAGVRRYGTNASWQRVCVTNTDAITQEYGTPEMLERYGSEFTAAAMELYKKSRKNADNAENDAFDKSPEPDTTLSGIIEASSVICAGKIIDGRDIDQNTKAFNIVVTSELKGAIEKAKIELYTQKPLRPGYIYIFFLREDSKKYDILSIASCDEYNGTILYDESLVLDIDYEGIDQITELREYIREGIV